MNPECLHTEVYFGSGDYYIFCKSCDRQWVTINAAHVPTPELSNRGGQSRLSGHVRIRPNFVNSTFSHCVCRQL